MKTGGKSEKKVLEAVKSGALTVREIATATGISRITLYKYLAVLDAKGLVVSRSAGNTKIYFCKSRKSHK